MLLFMNVYSFILSHQSLLEEYIFLKELQLKDIFSLKEYVPLIGL